LTVRNKPQETQRARTLSEAGILSDATWSKWEGLDHAQEQALGAKKQQGPGGPPGMGPPGVGGPPGPPSPPGSAILGEGLTWEELLEAESASAGKKVGDVWRGPSGRYFTLKQIGDRTRVVPAASPDRQASGKGAPPAATLDEARPRAHAAAKAGDVAGVAAALKGMKMQDIRALVKELGLGAKAREKVALAERAAKEAVERIRAQAPEVEDGSPPPDPRPGKVYNVSTEALRMDPTRFQYKVSNVGSEGVTDEFKKVKTWNPDFAGVVSVWKDPAGGDTFVVNGHHRRELAGRLGVKDMAVRYVTAKDAREARAIGALINIAEGRGTAVDAAKFMRDAQVSPEKLEGLGVSLKGRVAADAASLTRLSDRQFDRLARGILDEGTALAVARHLPDHNLQDQLFSLIDKREEAGKDISPRVIEEMAREMASTPTTTKTEASLFGDIESEESLFVPRAEVKAYVRAELAKEFNDFAAVASKRRAERVAGAGNVLDTEKNKALADEAEAGKAVFDTLVNSRGKISDAVNLAAAEYARATTRKGRDDAKRKAVHAVKQAIEAESRGAAASQG
jgi:hypothetical protein